MDERARLEQELASVRAALDATQERLAQRLAEDRHMDTLVAELRTEIDRLNQLLNSARTRIANMERSLFWRARMWLGRR
jgi:chromosome segregation ATPase